MILINNIFQYYLFTLYIQLITNTFTADTNKIG
jgi:hypothetical protein